VLLVALAVAGALLAPPATADVTVVRGAAACGGHTLVVGASRSSCFHSTPDLYDGRTAARWAGVAPATAPPRCYGDGDTGPRVQLLLGYLAGHRAPTAADVRFVRAVTAPRMQAVVQAASKGRDLGIRFAFTPGCGTLSLPVVRFPSSVVAGKQGTRPEVQLSRMVDVLRGQGFARTDRKYQVIWDWWNSEPVCGLGELNPSLDLPYPLNPHDGAPTAGARTDVGVLPPPQYSAVWHHALGPRGPSCWEQGQSKAEVQVHELFHTLGAVQLSAPHSDGGGHCTDTPSVMCPAPRKPTVPACALAKVQVLDCGMDDYWNPAPADGSYLATHLNVATSQYFGPQPQDSLAISPL
jgi:hypothetical protein